MEFEHNFAEQHETPERFPSKEEVRSVFEGFIKGRPYRELREENDETGLVLYEIEVVMENGEKIECNYQKAKYDYKKLVNHPGGAFSASIHFNTMRQGCPSAGRMPQIM